jgi:hypothetical protein
MDAHAHGDRHTDLLTHADIYADADRHARPVPELRCCRRDSHR